MHRPNGRCYNGAVATFLEYQGILAAKLTKLLELLPVGQLEQLLMV
jgi:hypothetical protein